MIRPHRLPAAEAMLPLAEDFSAINWGSPLSANIAEVFIPSTRGGMTGLRRGLCMIPRNGSRVATCPQGRYGDSVGAGMGFREVTPEYLRFSTWPVTIVWVGVQLATPTQYSNYFMVTHNADTSTSPYNSYGMYSNSNPVLAYNTGASQTTISSSVGITNNVLSVISCRITQTSQQITVNGVVGGTGSASVTGPSYTAASRIEFGSDEGNQGRSCNVRTLMGVILRGVWTNDQEREFARNPWQILSPGMRLSLGVIDYATYLSIMRYYYSQGVM